MAEIEQRTPDDMMRTTGQPFGLAFYIFFEQIVTSDS